MLFRGLPALAFLLPLISAASAANWSGSYYCSAKAEGGLKFNKITKTWESVRFKATDNFILNMRFVSTKPMQDVPNMTLDVYKVSLRSEGSQTELNCFAGGSGVDVEVTTRGVFSCEQLFFTYKFDMTAARYLQAYFAGYIDGDNDNNDTPFMAGGVCTKIN